QVARADRGEEISGKGLQPIARADDAPFQRRVIGAPSLRLMDVGGERTGSHAAKRLVERLDPVAEKAFGHQALALRRERLAPVPRVVRRVDDVVVPAPRAGEDRAVTRPRDARKVDGRAVAETRATIENAAQIGDDRIVAVEQQLQLAVAQAIEEDEIDA